VKTSFHKKCAFLKREKVTDFFHADILSAIFSQKSKNVNCQIDVFEDKIVIFVVKR